MCTLRQKLSTTNSGANFSSISDLHNNVFYSSVSPTSNMWGLTVLHCANLSLFHTEGERPILIMYLYMNLRHFAVTKINNHVSVKSIHLNTHSVFHKR